MQQAQNHGGDDKEVAQPDLCFRQVTVKSCGEGTSSDRVSDRLAGSGGKLPGVKSCFDTFLITRDKFLKLSLLSFTYL